jgi:uncharacterized peroxidase-related enzyme
VLIHPPPQDDSADELAQWYEQQSAAWGYLPNYAPLFASRPDVAAAWTRLNLAVRGGMDRRRFELATMAAARSRSSTYCLAAHATFLRDVCSDEEAVLALAADPGGSTLDEVDRAVVAFATQTATDPASVTADDVERLHAVGLDDADIADVVFAVAARCFFATVLDAGGAQADHQLADRLGPDTAARLAVGRPFATDEG